MISAEAASLAVQIAKGAIQVTNRIDLVLAEKEAVEGPLALPAPKLSLAPNKSSMVKGLKALLSEEPSPLSAGQRQAIEDALEDGDKGTLFDLVREHLPRLAASRSLDLNSTFVAAVRAERPDWAADPERVITAFFVGAGRDFREKSYAWRIALTTVDALAEFGAESTALFVRDKRVQNVVASVLKRFGESDLQKLDSNREVLYAALSATLNGLVDARESLQPENPWIDGLLDSLVAARTAMPAAKRDNFLVGLVSGEGYPALVGAVLDTAGSLEADASGFRDVASDFLKKVATLVKSKEDFEDFFQDHWGDLLRGGLDSVASHPPALLGDWKLLGEVLKRVAGDLAKHDDSKLLSSDTLFGIVKSTAAVVAANPDVAAEILGTSNRWVDKLVVSVAETIADEGIRAVFSPTGVEELFRDALATFAEQPELLVGGSELAGKLVRGILKELVEVESFGGRELAGGAVAGALDALAENPKLVGFGYPEVVAPLARRMAELVKDKQLTGVQAHDLLEVLLGALADNPELFLKLERKLGEGVVDVILGAVAGSSSSLVAGGSLVRITSAVFAALAKTGKSAHTSHSFEELVVELKELLSAGLARAEKELGHTLALPALPEILGLLVEAWATGNVGVIDPDNSNFKQLFAELSKRAAA